MGFAAFEPLDLELLDGVLFLGFGDQIPGPISSLSLSSLSPSLSTSKLSLSSLSAWLKMAAEQVPKKKKREKKKVRLVF